MDEENISMYYPKPENESARLEALRRYEILDAAPEQFYDDAVAMANVICDVPMALVTFIEEER